MSSTLSPTNDSVKHSDTHSELPIIIIESSASPEVEFSTSRSLNQLSSLNLDAPVFYSESFNTHSNSPRPKGRPRNREDRQIHAWLSDLISRIFSPKRPKKKRSNNTLNITSPTAKLRCPIYSLPSISITRCLLQKTCIHPLRKLRLFPLRLWTGTL